MFATRLLFLACSGQRVVCLHVRAGVHRDTIYAMLVTAFLLDLLSQLSCSVRVVLVHYSMALEAAFCFHHTVAMCQAILPSFQRYPSYQFSHHVPWFVSPKSLLSVM